jgi:hypothetical protein
LFGSGDIDIAILASEENLNRLRRALAELRAEAVFVPELSRDVLLKGHACHFYQSAALNRIEIW